MSNLNNHSGTIENPGSWKVPGALKSVLFVFLAVGIVTFLVALKTGYEKNAWSSLLINHFYFMSLGVGGLFFAAIQWVTGAMWSATVRRIAESFSAYLPYAIVTFLVVWAGAHHIYEWTHHDVVNADVILKGKSGYLNPGFFALRGLIALGIWILFSKIMIGNSLKQDVSGAFSLTAKNRSLSPLFLILFALTFTMVSFDQIMSLNPHWFSTIFGIYCFAGMYYATHAALCVFTIYFRRKGYLHGLVTEDHLHDIGKFMFAFVVFWAYIGFSQFMLIWYANLPEETGYYLLRMSSGWMGVSLFLLLGKFVAPFILLLPRDSKRNESLLLGVAIFMLVAQWIDVLWMVQPQFFTDRPHFTWVELGVTVGFLGLFGVAVTRFLGRNNLVAYKDPRIMDSLHHHQ